ncbi:MAG: hypothetical protein IPP77_04690 [Bacteroidetes bacterium]|nr:hypothetical protein [Bacteroidota bacterium]
MNNTSIHHFHIPVMGLAFTIDTPLKVARFGISSVISVMDDELVEKMREFHSGQSGETFVPILAKEDDSRAKRITAYLDLVNHLVNQQTEKLRSLPFEAGNSLAKYFELLPDTSPLKQTYNDMLQLPMGQEKMALQEVLRGKIVAGSIDVNIMSKVDRTNMAKDGTPLPKEFSDALTAFRGYANSTLDSSIIFSAGYNPRLYGYIENFSDFYPDEQGYLKKKIILKVSDYRSAITQGKIFAKKGLWVSEFRIESGLNCGGHAFATDGLLLGPIMEEFKKNKETLTEELFRLCESALQAKAKPTYITRPEIKITVQGGIGTSLENQFLQSYYQADSTGWGSPFLLVPEATNVDEETLQQLATAEQDDYYLSYASPLGIPFNNFRKSSSEKQRLERIAKGRPGSPCYKKMLSSNTEFTTEPICTASREYQNLKINQLKEKNLDVEAYTVEFNAIVEKDCLCEGLGTAALIKSHMPLSHQLKAVTICPGPNLAYFSEVRTLKQMVDHIYGRINLLNPLKRSHMFVNELRLYVTYLENEMKKYTETAHVNQTRHLKTFHANLLHGIEYYKQLIPSIKFESSQKMQEMKEELNTINSYLKSLTQPYSFLCN